MEEGSSNIGCADEDSPFDLFVKRSANMFGIWGNILNHISGTDVARCLKVSQSLRHVVGQCISSNTSLCHQMNNAACVSALSRSSFLSKTTCKFQRKKETDRKDTKNDMTTGWMDITRALDKTWYHQCRITGKISIQRLNMDTGSMDEAFYQGLQPMFTRPSMNVFPTMNPNKVFIVLDGLNRVLFNHTSKQREMLPFRKLSFGSPEPQWPAQELTLGDLSLPTCVRNRIFFGQLGGAGKKRFQVVMALAGSDGNFLQSFALYTREDVHNHGRKYHLDVKHQSSTEQVNVFCLIVDYIFLGNVY